MLKNRTRIMAVLAAVVALSGMVRAETWHLGQSKDWKKLSADNPDDKYRLEVARIKQLIEQGKTKAVGKALSKLKEDYPGIAGPDLDAFIKAEMLFAKGKLIKASRSYDKFLDSFYHDSELYQAALVRQFHIGMAFLSGRKVRILGIFGISGFPTGSKIMKRITARAGNSPIGIKAAVSIAKSCEKRKEFADAHVEWALIAARWPDEEIAKEALLGVARCRHSTYKGAEYESSDLNGRPFSAESYYDSAKASYEKYKSTYPQDANEIGVGKMLKQIDEELAYKDYNAGRYYERTGNKQAANLYYQMVVRQWPDSAAAEMAQKALSSDKADGEKVEK